jgi:hypothetical protein
MDIPIKAFCPKCYMTFDAGKNSLRAASHSRLAQCDKILCRRKGSGCVRKFSSINSANRHTYCYTREQVDKWSDSLKISADLNINFENLQISDIYDTEDIGEFLATSEDLMFPEAVPEGPPYKYRNDLTISELFSVVQRKMGKEFPCQNLQDIKQCFISMGYTTAEVLRTAKRNQGSWEFIYRDFKHISTDIVGVSHILKKILSKKLKIDAKKEE